MSISAGATRMPVTPMSSQPNEKNEPESDQRKAIAGDYPKPPETHEPLWTQH